MTSNSRLGPHCVLYNLYTTMASRLQLHKQYMVFQKLMPHLQNADALPSQNMDPFLVN